MFDELPDSASRSAMSDAEIDEAISAWTSAVASAGAHRLLFIAEKTSRNYTDDWDVVEDTEAAWESAADEVSLASGISRGRASGDMEIGLALTTRLSKIAALLLAGKISERIARRIVARTALIQDPELLAQVEAEIETACLQWGALSQKRLDAAIDVWVDRFDPGALRRTRARVRDRGVDIMDSKDRITEILLRLKGADAALYWRRVTIMAQGVCQDDPRTLDQRRADAHGAIGAGYFHLACECGNPRCPAANDDDGRASSVVVHIYAEEAALAAELDPSMDGTETETETETETGQTVAPSECDHDTTAEPASTDEAPPAPVVSQSGTRSKAEGRFNPRPRNTMAPAPDAETGVEENFSDSGTTDEPAASAESVGEADPRVTSAEAEQDSSPGPIPPAAVRRPPPGIIVGFGDVPAPLIAALLAKGATARTLKPPGIDPEPQYRPLTALDEWVRARDLTCRFPNCDRPAEFCDWDHTVPWPAGPTHASGGKLMCRIHHLRKTFWPGWSDVQHPDGTVVWTTPTGRTYTTKPGAQLFFPSVNTTSAPIATGTPKPNTADKMAMMPKRRKRNRAKERASRITAERALNDAHVAEVNNPPF